MGFFNGHAVTMAVKHDMGTIQGDLTMGVCFSRISMLLAAVVQLLLWGTVNSFSHKIFDFCRQLPETEIAFFNKKNKKIYVKTNQL